jgi:hypothetical protein
VDDLDFEDWVRYCFDRPIEDPQWYWQEDETGALKDWYSPEARQLARYLRTLFEDVSTYLRPFTDAQIAQGLYYICSVGSDYFFVARQPPVPHDDQVAWVLAIQQLYAQLFLPRCTHYDGHRDSGPEAPHPLNTVCYMFWDLDRLEGAAMVPGHEHLVDPIFQVLSYALFLPSPACNESALHGLGHLRRYHPGRVERLIDDYLQRSDLTTPSLVSYARAARQGHVL